MKIYKYFKLFIFILNMVYKKKNLICNRFMFKYIEIIF
jgi:hypothetical protein